jgi:excisionase family DNA binding protein
MNKSVPLFNKPFYTISEVAERHQVCARTVYRWIDLGEIVSHRFGTGHRIAHDDLMAFERARRGL